MPVYLCVVSGLVERVGYRDAVLGCSIPAWAGEYRVHVYMHIHMGGCQNYGPFLGTLNNRCRIIIGTQKGAIILTTTHMCLIPAADGVLVTSKDIHTDVDPRSIKGRLINALTSQHRLAEESD